MKLLDYLDEIKKEVIVETSVIENEKIKMCIEDEVHMTIIKLSMELHKSPLLGTDVTEKEGKVSFVKNDKENTNAIKAIIKYRLLVVVSKYLEKVEDVNKLLEIMKNIEVKIDELELTAV